MIYSDFKNSKIRVDNFINSIEKSLGISKSTFYNWLNDPIINSYKLNIKYDNKIITPAIEQIILSNKNLTIKSIKQKIQHLNIILNKNSIRYVLFNNNLSNANLNNNHQITTTKNDTKTIKK